MGYSEDVSIEAWQNGAAFHVKAHAGAKREGLAGIHDGMLRLEVTAAPEKGKANKALLKLLAKLLGVPPAGIELLSGDTNARKRFGVRGVSPDKLRNIMRAWQ